LDNVGIIPYKKTLVKGFLKNKLKYEIKLKRCPCDDKEHPFLQGQG
jgi:hypothetical protein